MNTTKANNESPETPGHEPQSVAHMGAMNTRQRMIDRMIARAEQSLCEVPPHKKQTVFFDPRLAMSTESLLHKQLSHACDNIFNIIFPKREGMRKVIERRKYLEMLIVNLTIANMRVSKRQRKRIALSMDNGAVMTRAYGINARMVRDVVGSLEDNGFIHRWPGVHYKNFSRLTAIMGRHKLWTTLKDMKSADVGDFCFPLSETVILRDAKKKRVMVHRYPPSIKQFRLWLKCVNMAHRKHVATFLDELSGKRQRILTDLHAVYNNSSWEAGGRMYSGELGYLSLSKRENQGAERKTIEIDGQATVELDFSGLHICMLYAEKGTQWEGDPYRKIYPGEKQQELRPILKKVMLILINEQTPGGGEKACNYELKKDRSGSLYRLLLRQGLTMRMVCEKVKEVHCSISDAFESGAALRLMNKDSLIARDVMDHFFKKDVPILPVHDSFIVQAKYRDELEEVMKKTYYNHIGFTIAVK